MYHLFFLYYAKKNLRIVEHVYTANFVKIDFMSKTLKSIKIFHLKSLVKKSR